MKAILYFSEATTDFSFSDVWSLASSSASHNKGNGITGFLSFNNRFFFQYLEGEEDSVMAIMGQIANDPRHRILYAIEERDVEASRFADWRMQLVEINDNPNTLLEYHLAEQFDALETCSEDKPACKALLENTLTELNFLNANEMIRLVQPA